MKFEMCTSVVTLLYTLSFQNLLWFNIGSVDSFERNLELAQAQMNIDSANFLPVIYKTEIELSSLSGILPTLLIIGESNHHHIFFFLTNLNFVKFYEQSTEQNPCQNVV